MPAPPFSNIHPNLVGVDYGTPVLRILDCLVCVIVTQTVILTV